jgi:ribosomal protein L44E
VKDPKIHEGVKCKGCNVSPIVGVRFSCMGCEDFDLCEKCEATTEHEHDFIKMKKARREDSLRKNFRQWKKMGRGYLRENFRKNAITSGSESKSKERGPNPWRRGGEMVIKRRTTRLSKIYGGKPEDYLEYVNKTLELELQDIICNYAKENNINLEEKIKDNFEQKLQRLSFFYNKSCEEYRDIVVQNPSLHFRGIVKILKEKGLEDFNGDNFKQMREKMQEAKA